MPRSERKTAMKIWMYVDEFASMESSTEEEYAEIEAAFREWLPDVKLSFKRGASFMELRNGRPDFYVWDIGGLCYVDHSGDKRVDWCHEVVDQIESHPNTLFVPWTMMTQDYLRFAVTEFLPEFADKEDKTYPEAPVRPNLWCPPKSNWEDERAGLGEAVKGWAK